MTRTRLLVAAGIAVAVAIAGAGLVACGLDEHVRGSRHVPATYREVRASIGHTVHVGKLPCADCHGDDFTRPAGELCESCHAVTSPLHPPTPTTANAGPTCTACVHPAGKGHEDGAKFAKNLFELVKEPMHRSPRRISGNP